MYYNFEFWYARNGEVVSFKQSILAPSLAEASDEFNRRVKEIYP